MNRLDYLLNRLARNARRDAALSAANEMPHGFTTRVLAEVHADDGRNAEAWRWERLTLRAIPVAAALRVICAVLAPRPPTVVAEVVVGQLLALSSCDEGQHLGGETRGVDDSREVDTAQRGNWDSVLQGAVGRSLG